MIEKAARALISFLNEYVGNGISIESDDQELITQFVAHLQQLENSMTNKNPEKIQSDIQKMQTMVQKMAQEVMFAMDDHIQKFLIRIEGRLPTPQEYKANAIIVVMDDPAGFRNQYLIWKNKYVQQTRANVDRTGITVQSRDVPEENWPSGLKKLIEEQRQKGFQE